MISKTKKILIWTASVFIALVLILCAFALITCAVVFDDNPYMPPKQILNLGVYTQTYGKLKEAMRNTESPDEIRSLVLTDTEVNSLLTAGAVYANAHLNAGRTEKQNRSAVSASLKDEIFTVHYTILTPYKTPFGSYINLMADFKMEWKKGKLDIDVKSVRVKNHSLSKDIVEKTLKKRLADILSKPVPKSFLACIVSAEADGNKFKIKYYPVRLLYTIDRNFFGGFGIYPRLLKR